LSVARRIGLGVVNNDEEPEKCQEWISNNLGEDFTVGNVIERVLSLYGKTHSAECTEGFGTIERL